jgi:hypothetical protein
VAIAIIKTERGQFVTGFKLLWYMLLLNIMSIIGSRCVVFIRDDELCICGSLKNIIGFAIKNEVQLEEI